MTQITADDGHAFDAYEVDPGGASAAVVIVQEIFGVNAHIRSVVDRYAALGYRAVAPAVFDRLERGVTLDYDDAGIARGRELMGQLDFGDVVRDVAATVAHVADSGPVGVVGFCFGGSVAWVSSQQLPVAAAVGYYGGHIPTMLDPAPAAPVLLHFGAEDHGIPLDRVEAIAAAHPDVPIHVYDGAGHGFSCDARGSFDPIAATIALGRTIDFLVSNGVRP